MVEEELLALRARASGPSGKGSPDRESRHRIELLERENQLLRQRIALAREMVEKLQARLRFIEDRGEVE